MVSSLYRSYLRQIGLLPHLYLRQFFKIKARDEVQAILTTKDDRLRAHRIASVSKSINLVGRANMGKTKAFDRVLDLAYGRKGKIRWELMQPLLSDPSAPLPQPIIPTNKKSRPPVYSPALKALLTSAYSRTTKPLKIGNLVNPPVLPARADPSSADARIFGPLSKRREVNIRRCYFASEWKKVFPPIEVHVGPDASTFQNKMQSAKQLIPGFGMQVGVFADIEETIGILKTPSVPRRERSLERAYSETGTKAGHSSRWLQRRYRSLLNRLPMLLHNPSDNSGSFSVQRSELSLPPYQRPIPYLPEVDSRTLAWLEASVTK
ncbi:hypothetical protein BYT27DRAFT_7189850 [Phlegmacium glaucopus]|nr:hypothetical protein BYT27DRAFT_7189850 [Phlegmacium glaucopus]